MVQPKTFYKKVETVLNRIFRGKTGRQFLITLLKELENVFEEEINVDSGRIYEDQGGAYILVYPDPDDPEFINYPKQISAVSEAIESVLRYGSYIFNDPEIHIESANAQKYPQAIPAAFSVNSKDRQWVFVFDLKSGWLREEIEFCFNTIREALNFRLQSEQIKSDLQQAVAIQESLLPQAPPDFPGLDIALRSEAAETVVGDLYDFYELDRDLLGISIGDACGHGLPAALLVRDVVTGLRMGLEKEMKMVHTIKKLNSVIHRSNFSTRFISLFFCEIEADGNLIYVNAGHPPPMIISDGDIRELPATGTTIGFLPELKLQRVCSRIQPEGILLLYSDGITERRNSRGEEFGLARLKALIQQHREESVRTIVDALFEAVFEFGNRTDWKDDASLVVVKRVGEKPVA